MELTARRTARPRGEVRHLLPQVRVVFFGLYAAQVLASGIAQFVVADVVHERAWLVLLALAALVAVAVHRVRTSTTPAVLDGAAALALVCGVWGAELDHVYGVVFVGAMYRALYGRWPGLVLSSALQASVLVGYAVAVGSQLVTTSVLSVIPGLVCVTGAFHLLAVALHRYETGNESRFQALVRGSSDAIFITDAETAVVYASPALLRVFGPPATVAPDSRADAPADAPGGRGRSGPPGRPSRLLEWVVPQDRDDLSSAVEALLAPAADAEAVSVTCRVRDGNGALRHVELSVRDALDLRGVHGLIVNARDVSARVALAEQLRQQVLHDALTGLPNRVLFADRLARAMDAAEAGAAVLLVDLDGFKAVNDTYGHQAGDDLLVAVGERLQGCVGAQGTAARLGGDEFAVLLTGVAGESPVRDLGERLLAAIAAPVHLRRGVVHPAASIGAALRSDRHADPDVLLHDADLALYRAKAAGAHRVVLHDQHVPDAPEPAPTAPPPREAADAAGARELQLQHRSR